MASIYIYFNISKYLLGNTTTAFCDQVCVGNETTVHYGLPCPMPAMSELVKECRRCANIRRCVCLLIADRSLGLFVVMMKPYNGIFKEKLRKVLTKTEQT